MKYLLINQTFYPDKAATSQYLTDLARQLKAKGHDVDVLTSRRSYTEPAIEYSKYENYFGIHIYRIGSLRFNRQSLLGRIMEMVFMNSSIAWRLLWMHCPDRIYVLTSPPFVALVALIYAKWKRVFLTCWMMDINPDQAIEIGWIKRRSWQARIFNRALKLLLRHANEIIVLDHYMQERLSLQADRARIRAVPLWGHEQEIQVIEHSSNPFRKEHGFEGKFIIMYSGNHSLCHPLDTLLGAAKILNLEKDIQFVFIGGGPRVSEVTRYKELHALQNIIQLPYQERATLPFSLSAADIHAVILGNAFSGIVHPSKIYDILNLGKPFVFIGPPKSFIGDIVAEHNVGFRVDHGQSEMLASLIRQIKTFSSQKRAELYAQTKKMSETYSQQKVIDLLIRSSQ